MRRCRPSGRFATAVIVGSFALTAQAFGPDGHRVAGGVAEAYLCSTATREVERLGAGDTLGELGLWADRIRGDERWRISAPWHYMNIADGAALSDYRSPPEGDVLWAIAHFA